MEWRTGSLIPTCQSLCLQSQPPSFQQTLTWLHSKQCSAIDHAKWPCWLQVPETTIWRFFYATQQQLIVELDNGEIWKWSLQEQEYNRQWHSIVCSRQKWPSKKEWISVLLILFPGVLITFLIVSESWACANFVKRSSRPARYCYAGIPSVSRAFPCLFKWSYLHVCVVIFS